MGGFKMIILDSNKYNCPIERTLDAIGGKWKPIILWGLVENKVMRYGEIKRYTRKITNKVLSSQLKDLEADGIIFRKQYNEMPPRVEYSLSPKGESLVPILENMCKWGENNL